MHKHLLVLVLLAACAAPTSSDDAVMEGRSALEQGFAQASSTYAVPESLLKGIAWVESRFQQLPGEAAAHGGQGLMRLEDSPTRRTLTLASQLTGHSTQTLREDPAANVAGGAAVLRFKADRIFRANPELDPARLGDWFPVVLQYPELDAPALANAYAVEVFAALARGQFRHLEDGLLTLEPQPADYRGHQLVEAARAPANSDHPEASWSPSPNFTSGRHGYDAIVLQTTESTAAAALARMQDPSSLFSTHYLVRSSDGGLVQLVAEPDSALHAGCADPRTIGIALEAMAGDPAWFSDELYRTASNLVLFLSERHGIPRDRLHVVGSAEAGLWCGEQAVGDPGPGFDWERLLKEADGDPNRANGRLVGFTYFGTSATDLASRIAGATVRILETSDSTTSAADGRYEFSLPPGPYTIEASAVGYQTATLQRTVPDGGLIFGSISLTPISAGKGFYNGTVYEVNPITPADMANTIEGATVTLSNGDSVVTGAAGTFSFEVDPASYTATATKAGYVQNSSSGAVTAGATHLGPIGLNPAAAVDVTAPAVVLEAPASGGSVDAAQVVVRGSASDDLGPISKVRFVLNGGTAAERAVAGGRFEFGATLQPGDNALVIEAVDAAGNVGRAQANVRFRSGISGFVFEGEDQGRRLSGAVIELLSAGGEAVGDADSGLDGSFRLDCAPGSYRLRASADGYEATEQAVTVGSDSRAQVRLGLFLDGSGPTFILTTPENGARVSRSPILVSGSCLGFQPVAITVNGVPASIGEGIFEATVELAEGPNTITAIATRDGAGSLTATLEVTLEAAAAQPSAKLEESCGCSMGGQPAALAGLFALLALLKRRTRSV